MRQHPQIGYVFYTSHGENIRILVRAIRSYPFVVGSGPPSFYAHPVDPVNDSRLFTFTEANPPDVDAVTLVFSFPEAGAGVRYEIEVSGSDGGGTFFVDPVIQHDDLVLQHLGLLFLAENDS